MKKVSLLIEFLNQYLLKFGYLITQKIIIGSIYRPAVNHPTLSSSEQFLQFFELLTNLLDDFSDKNIPVYLQIFPEDLL